MTREQFRAFAKKFMADTEEGFGQTQKEYTPADNNAFDNFERTAKKGKISRELALMVYLDKHVDGIWSYINGQAPQQRESLESRIQDAIRFLVLLAGMKAAPEAGSWIPVGNAKAPLQYDWRYE